MENTPNNHPPSSLLDDDAPIGNPAAERRQLLINTTTAFAVAGAACVAVPFLRTMSPSRATEALATVDINLAEVPLGSMKTFLWQGKPVFVWHRTPAQIATAKAQDATSTMQAQPDAERVQKPEWLVVLGICSHLGCVPMQGGKSDGWLCPCHGSQFDLSGRVTQGPAGKNLDVPPYQFLNETTIRVG